MKCNFITPEKNSFYRNLLLPIDSNSSIKKTIFSSICNYLFKDNNYKLDESSLSTDDLQITDFEKQIFELSFLDTSIRKVLLKIHDDEFSLLKPYFSQFLLEELAPFNTLLSEKVYKLGISKIYCGHNSRYTKEFLKNFSSSLEPLCISGRSGCGKTSFIAKLGEEYPVIYLDILKQQSYFNTYFLFDWMNKKTEPLPNDRETWIIQQKNIRDFVKLKLLIYAISSMLFIIYRKQSDSYSDHSNFIICLEQMNGASEALKDTASRIFDLKLGVDFLSSTFDKLKMIIERDIGKPIIFAIDEIQSFTATYGDVIMLHIFV